MTEYESPKHNVILSPVKGRFPRLNSMDFMLIISDEYLGSGNLFDRKY